MLEGEVNLNDWFLASRGDTTWMEQAACIGHDPDFWYSGFPRRAEMAKTLCAGCPVRVECLADALSRDEEHGIWGGLDPNERAALRAMKARSSLVLAS